MTREIKFRGKRIDTGEWVYGGIYQPPDATFIVTFMEFQEPIDEGGQIVYIPELNKVNHNTIGQASGVTDKEGKEIYEGDFIQCFHNYQKQKYGAIEAVKFTNGAFWLPIWETSLCKYLEDFKKQVEVIGNVHDHHKVPYGQLVKTNQINTAA